MSLEEQIQSLESEISRELEIIAQSLEQRYVHFVPLMNSAQGDIEQKLEELCGKVDEKLAHIDSFIKQTSISEIATTEKALKRQLSEIAECREVVEKMSQIDQHIVSFRTGSFDILEEARMIRDCEDLLKEIIQDESGALLTERIRGILRDEVNDAVTMLKCRLGTFFEQFVSYPERMVKGITQMQIRNENVADTSRQLTAMSVLNHLDSRLEKWASLILRHFCQTIIASRDGCDVIETSVAKIGVMIFTANSKAKNNPGKTIDVTNVLDVLASFFMQLGQALTGVQVSGRQLTLLLGKNIEEPLMNMILKECISIAVPLSDPNDPCLAQAMEAAEKFRNKMIDLDVFNDASPTFAHFAEAHLSVFIDRRCLEVVTQAKRLICQPYLELETVGSAYDVDEETILDYAAAFNQPVPSLKNCDQTFPKLLQLPQCQVSKSTVELVDLVFCALKDAIETENEALCARLALTARNIVHMFILVAPRHHQAAISSVPQMAAVFYNNCYFLCHRLLMLPFGLLKDVKRDSSKFAHFSPLFVDFIWKLREIAADWMEQVLAQCRRQISATLADRQMFVNLNDHSQLKLCKKMILACLMQVQAIATVWENVLTETVYCKSLGNVVSFLLCHVASLFLEAEDIRAHDAETAASILETMIDELEKLFIIRGQSCIHEMCDTAYFRIKEIIFCLNGTLQSIDDRWCDRKGPLAQWLTPNEVRSLIKAIFMNTEQRKKLLDTIY